MILGTFTLGSTSHKTQIINSGSVEVIPNVIEFKDSLHMTCVSGNWVHHLRVGPRLVPHYNPRWFSDIAVEWFARSLNSGFGIIFAWVKGSAIFASLGIMHQPLAPAGDMVFRTMTRQQPLSQVLGAVWFRRFEDSRHSCFRGPS